MEKYINQIVAIDTILKNPPDAHYPSWFAAQIADLPAADVVEVVHGEWVWKELCGEVGYMLVCSECEESEGACVRFDYCPNCGAKMDGGQE